MTQDTPNTSTETAGAYLADGDGACWIYDDLKIIKKLRPARGKPPPRHSDTEKTFTRGPRKTLNP
jgi:hypothetical protein